MSGVVFFLPGTTVDAVAAAVRDALAVELARLDVNLSTRATPADVAVSVTAEVPPTGTVS